MTSISFTKKAEYRRAIDRTWAPYLTSAEARVVSFVFTTTIEWGKPEDRLKVSHFVYGIGNASGTGLCDKTVRTALNTLHDDGAILRFRTPFGYRISLNFDWNPAMLRVPKHNREHQLGSLSGSKKGKVIGKNYLSRSVNFTDPYSKGHTDKVTYPSPSPSARTVAQSSEELQGHGMRAKAAIDRVKADSKKAADAAKALRKTDIVSMARLWSSAFRETFPEASVPVWGKREQGQAKLFIRTTVPTDATHPLDVFEWCVRSWRLIVSSRFAWMTDAPDLPALGFMLRFKDRFYEAWNERERLRRDIVVTGAERHIRKLVHRGLTHEEAAKETADRASIASERIALAEKARDLDAALRRAEQRDTARDRALALREPKGKAPSTVVRPKLGGFDDF